MSTETVYFVQIGDTHIGPTPDFSQYDHKPLPSAQRLVDVINALPATPDFVVHTGDVVADPHPKAYKLAARTFAELNVPIYYVNGNHDTAADIRRYLSMGPKEDLIPEPDVLCYAFQVKGYRFLVLDARGPKEIDPHGLLSEEQLAILQQEAQPDGLPLVIFVHFPALPLDSVWMDAYMLMINGQAFHQALLPARQRLRGVFHGHVHRPMQTVRDGIVYTAVGSTFYQFTAWPRETTIGHDPDHLPAYSFVHLLPEQTIVHHHTFPRP